MPYYISAFLIYYIGVAFLFQEGVQRRSLIFVICIAPLVFLALSRGDVGTDTAAYLNIVDQIKDYGDASVESGFVLIVKALLNLGAEPRQVIALVGFITTAVLISASLFSGRAMMVSALCIVPIFYLDMTMNALRLGLSFALAMCSIALFVRNRVAVSFFFGVCSVLVYISGFALFVIMALLAVNKVQFKRWVAFSAGLALVILFHYMVGIYYEVGVNFADKYKAYMQYPSPNWLSGLAPFILSIIVLSIIRSVDQRDNDVCTRRFYFLLLLVILTFMIAKISYAGLRLQTVVLFAMLVALQYKPEFAVSLKLNSVRRGMILVGVLGMFAFLKNIYVTEGLGASPFLPYSINPDLRVIVKMGGQ